MEQISRTCFRRAARCRQRIADDNCGHHAGNWQVVTRPHHDGRDDGFDRDEINHPLAAL